ncbi:MAG: hypothetical protein ACJAVZ_005327 [Afipia broomeae]|nr:MAG: hypothetical protein EKK35_21170 [Bradyrhizobiaceae bacterium]
MKLEASLASKPAVEIRPGVFRPNWSFATSVAARRALHGRIAARAGLLDQWSHRLEATEDTVWRTALQLYGASGRAPSVSEIAEASGILPNRVVDILRKLQSHDLVALDQTSNRIRLAYPFTDSVTGYRVELNGHVLHALCAIDALGVADMYDADTAISSPCVHCGETIRARTAYKGSAVQSFSPLSAVVWYDFAYDGRAASSCCLAIAFFCSDGHLQQWLDFQKVRREGIRLTMDQALEVGRAIFGPVLAE